MAKARAVIILAAGRGTRMKSALPKPLHAVGGRSMLDWSLALARECGADRKVVIWGPHGPEVKTRAEEAGALAALQDPPMGTGHAVLCATEALANFDGDVAVLFADTPLIRAHTLEAVFRALDTGANVAVLGFEPADPAGYGRLLENGSGMLTAIVEEKDATEQQKAVRLCNSGVLAARAPVLFELLSKVTNKNAKGEYYLTDIIALGVEVGHTACAVRADASEVLGVNSRAELASAEAAFQARARTAAMDAGVTLIAPETVFFSHDTQIANDVIVEPNVVFGPGVKIETGAVIHAFSHLQGAHLGENTSVGPYARLRPGAVLENGARIGNFVEVKNAILHAGAKANHLSYIGDADIGEMANIGAGTITCNYDGFFKHRTIIGDGAFIGSNTALVAPVTIGRGAFTGSGSVITSDVPDDALALSRVRQENRVGWAARFRQMMQARKDKKAHQTG